MMSICGGVSKGPEQHNAKQVLCFWRSSSELDRLEAGFKTAVKQYRQAAKSGLCEGPFVIAKLVSLPTYEEWALGVETSWKIAYFPTANNKGMVLLYGDPTKVHEGVVEWLKARIQHQFQKALKDTYFDSLVYLLGTSEHKLPSGVSKQPDCAYTSKSAKKPRKPRMTIEVAYKNEDLDRLVNEVVLWHNWEIIFSLGIKIEAKKSGMKGNKKVDLRMYWVQQLKDEARPSIIEFSPGLCTEANQSEFAVGFFFSYLTSDISPEMDFYIRFDLHELQKKILDLVMDEAEDNNSIMYIDEYGELKVGENALCYRCLMSFDDKKMVQCDSCDSWYHLECLGMEAGCLTQSTWLCQPCTSMGSQNSLLHLSSTRPRMP